jgi:hypothetical protein
MGSMTNELRKLVEAYLSQDVDSRNFVIEHLQDVAAGWKGHRDEAYREDAETLLLMLKIVQSAGDELKPQAPAV